MNQFKTSIFQQDGAPCHSARLVTQWFENSDYQLLKPWPGNSPDLNPIENCWAILKKKVSLVHCSSYEQLVDTIKRVWKTEISPEYCKNLIESMPDRLIACDKNHGGSTKY